MLSGTLHDPYSGTTVVFQRGQGTSSQVQVDHVVPLLDAWQKGAQQWDDAKRRNFANDPTQLDRRRRTPALEPLSCGCVDPACVAHHPLHLDAERELRAWRRAMEHLESCGLTPIVPAEIVELARTHDSPDVRAALHQMATDYGLGWRACLHRRTAAPLR